MNVCLTIAGIDNLGFSGVYADLRTFHALGCYGVAAITALTIQTHDQVMEIKPTSEEFLKKQIQAAFNVWKIDAIKIGMIYSLSHIYAINDLLLANSLSFPCACVLDPIIKSSSGKELLEPRAQKEITKLFPHVKLITPNLPEILFFLKKDEEPQNINELKKLVEEFYLRYQVPVLLKGGHFNSNIAYDVFFDGDQIYTFEKEKIPKSNIRGTGCALSSAITAYLAQNMSLLEAIKNAKEYINLQIQNAQALPNTEYHFLLHRPDFS
ncbi:MAG: hydroxymethylpyrimidine/phosphomethylpyrimidine kinase [Leptospiraceae bacterium]|nr:hydroxymethylpyrimidine/phosphomethylpyrimidine kinase [Leptospiraceae bacterium]MDW7976841.1 hydroxymethylpyrimidine/phosphomethylpyrimidine kinase [Leptospiraceae bacterium]